MWFCDEKQEWCKESCATEEKIIRKIEWKNLYATDISIRDI